MSLSDKIKPVNRDLSANGVKGFFIDTDVKQALKELMDSGEHNIKVPQTIKIEYDKFKEIFGKELLE